MKIKKEAIMATVIGLIIGLIITGGILRAQNAIKQTALDEESTPSKRPISTSDPSQNDEISLTIQEPEDNLVVSENTVTLTGTTLAGTYIAIIAEKNEYLIVPNEVGQFTQEITLISGANTITITVYDKQGNKIEKTLNIVYTSEEI